MMTGLYEWDGPPSMSPPPPKCPECRSKMEMTQVYESLGDFYMDGLYHWEWRCKCGHEEKVEVEKP